MVRSLLRILSFTSNWTSQVLRQPSMVLLMLAGPFLIVFLFGVGNTITQPLPRTVVVIPDQETESQLPPKAFEGYLTVVGTARDEGPAISMLRQRQIDMVVSLPQRPIESVEAGRKAIAKVYVNEIDPVAMAFIRTYVQAQLSVANNALQMKAIDDARPSLLRMNGRLSRVDQVSQQLGVPRDDVQRVRDAIDGVLRIPSEVLVSPIDADVENVSPGDPHVMTYFIPTAIALVIQHLAVTLAGLSMVRVRLFGTIELWQTAPVRLGEIIAGNYLSYGLLTLVVSVALILAILEALNIPILGPQAAFWGSIVLLGLASLGIGFVISMLVGNEQTAAQAAMLVLLASIFLGGLIRPLESIVFPVRYLSYLLPSTYAVQLLHEIVVRGQPGQAIYFVALGAIALVGLVATAWLLHRELTPK